MAIDAMKYGMQAATDALVPASEDGGTTWDLFMLVEGEYSLIAGKVGTQAQVEALQAAIETPLALLLALAYEAGKASAESASKRELSIAAYPSPDPLRCRYADCPEHHPLAVDFESERDAITCPTCRRELGLPEVS